MMTVMDTCQTMGARNPDEVDHDRVPDHPEEAAAGRATAAAAELETDGNAAQGEASAVEVGVAATAALATEMGDLEAGVMKGAGEEARGTDGNYTSGKDDPSPKEWSACTQKRQT